MKTQAEALLMADVQTTTLIIEGRIETPERVKAMTKGDCCAVPVETLRAGSSDGLEGRSLVSPWYQHRSNPKTTYTIMPTTSMLRT
jgi:hypothetical protein